MTVDVSLPRSRPETGSRRVVGARGQTLTHGLVAVALGWWALALTRDAGGTDGWSLVIGIALCLPALAVTKVGHIRSRVLALALTPGLVALVLNLTSPTGWTGLDTAASALYAGLLALVVLGYARTPSRRLVVVAWLAVAALDQFGQGWLAWWGGGDTQALMLGSFGWHNPFAAFLAGPVVIGWCLLMRGSGAARLAAALTVPWLGAAIMLSGSRATLGLCVLAALGLAVFSVRGWDELAWLAGGVVSAPMAVWLLSAPWLMGAGSALPVAATNRVESGSGNFILRAYYDWAGLQLAARRPLTGAGYDSYGPAGSQYMPDHVAASDYVHNGWIQALVDGGIVLAIPVVIATAWPAIRALRRVLAGRRAGANAVQLGASTAVLVLLAHALFDIDWQYPSVVALFAITAALLPWRTQAMNNQRAGSGAAPIATSAFLVVTLLLAVTAGLMAAALRQPDAELPRWAAAVESAVPFHSWALNAPNAERDGQRLLQAATLDPATFDGLMASTSRAAMDDPALAQIRSLALALRGERSEALDLSDQALPERPRPTVVLLRAEVLEQVGDVAAARLWVELNLARLQELQGNVPTAELEEWLDVRGTRTSGVVAEQPGSVGSGGVDQ